MHISDGVLPAAVWGAGLAVTAGAVAISVRRFDERRIPQIAVLTSLFFVASLIQIPVGLTSVHLLLVGLMGIILGWLSFPALLVALFLQYVLLGVVGGITTLGVNTLTMGCGALVSRWLFLLLWRGGNRWPLCPQAFVASVCGVLCSGAAYIAIMATAGKDLESLAKLIFLAHIPVVLLDGLVTAAAVSFLLRVKPELIPGRRRVAPRPPASAKLSLHSGALVESPAAGISSGCTRLPICLLACCLLFAPDVASAHGLRVRARTYGERVKVQAIFLDGTPVRGATVVVRVVPPEDQRSAGVEGDAVAEGTTDQEGAFLFRPRKAETIEVVVDEGSGHRERIVIPAARLAPLFSAMDSAGEPAGAAGAESDGQNDGVLAGSGDGVLSALGPLWVRVILGLVAIAGLAILTRWVARMGRKAHAS